MRMRKATPVIIRKIVQIVRVTDQEDESEELLIFLFPTFALEF